MGSPREEGRTGSGLATAHCKNPLVRERRSRYKKQDLTLKITRKGGAVENVLVRCRIDTPIEIDYYQHGGILPYVLRQIVAKN